MSVTIYHNPDCGTSRNTLAMIRNAGIEPEIIEYLKSPPDRATLKDLIERAGSTVRAALREKGTPYAELGLSESSLSDEQLLDAMMEHPDPHQPPACRHAARRAPVPPLRGRAGHPARSAEGLIHERGRRAGGR